MSDSCHKIEDLLPDFLDNDLDRQLRERVEHHLATCQKCRDNLALQRQWLQKRDALAADALTASDGLNQRIMAAVRAENANRQPVPQHNRAVLWRKPWIWRSLAGSAAAVVLLVAFLQFLPHLLAATAKTSLSQNESAALTTAAVLKPTAAEATPQDTRTAGGWTIISGQAFSLTGLDTAMASSGDAQVDAMTNAFSCIASLPEYARDSIAGVLDQSADVRVMYMLAPQQQALILAAFNENQVNSQADLIKNALASCETPIQIEIIRTEDLQAKLAGLDETLFYGVFPDPIADTSWIYILIGA